MSRDYDGLVHSQADLYSRLSRAYENLKKTSSTKLTLGMAEARLQALEANWARFESQHVKLLSYPEAIAESDYFKQEIPSLAEEAFLQQKGTFLDLIRSLKAREAATVPVGNSDGATAAPRTTLPRIQLPQFNGRYEDWPAFRDLFQSILGRDSAITKVEKLHYLKTSLKGEAEILIRDLSTTGDNYERAWKILSAYYENKRLLVRAYISSFLSLNKMKSESAAELRKIFHGIKATVSSLEGIGRPISNSEDLFVYLTIELLDPRSRREWEASIRDSQDPPSYSTMEQFLEQHLRTLESMAPAKPDSSASKSSGTKAARSHLTRKQETKPESKVGHCTMCSKDHFLLHCEEYKGKAALNRKEFVVEKGLCLNCLGRHQVSECASKKNCSACGARHHSSIHDACREGEIAKTLHISRSTRVAQTAVLLATARVRIFDRFGGWHVARALVDQGSETTIISERLVQKLRLPRSSASVAVFGISGDKTTVAKGRVALSFSPRTGGRPITITALVLSRLTIYAGGIDAGKCEWAHIRAYLELADPEYEAEDPIDILLGADAYAIIIQSGLRKGNLREPIAQETTLGWILSGGIDGASSGTVSRTHQCHVEEDLGKLVRGLWEQEEVPTRRAVSKEDQACEEHYRRFHARKADGRYTTVRLPTVDPLPEFSSPLASNGVWRQNSGGPPPFTTCIENLCSSTPPWGI